MRLCGVFHYRVGAVDNFVRRVVVRFPNTETLRRRSATTRALRVGCADALRAPFPPLHLRRAAPLIGKHPTREKDGEGVGQTRFMVNTHTPRPRLTIREAVEQFDVSRSTIKRGLVSGRYEGAERDDAGAWLLPVEALHREHAPRHDAPEPSSAPQSTNRGQGAVSGGHDLERRVMELEQALAIEQAERRAAERVADAEARRAEMAERALLMIEAAPGRAAPAAPAEPSPVAQRAPEIAEPPRAAEVIVEPLGRRLRRVFRPRG